MQVMNTKPLLSKNITAAKLTLSLLFAFTLTACSTTEQGQVQSAPVNKNMAEKTTMEANSRCQNHAKNIALHAETVGSTAQYLASAKAMNNCISTALQNRGYNSSQTQQDIIMKMMAVATLNFIKAGDVSTATREVERFKRIYPNQDLYFEDYTSFLDTATALLSTDDLSAAQMSSLNISRALRDEIERKNYWLNH